MELKRNNSGLYKTKSAYEFNFHRDEKITSVEFPAEYFCAPQFYYTDQSRFEAGPRQLQTYLAGRVQYPIPMELPAFTDVQTKYSEFLRENVQIGNVFVSAAEFQNLVGQATAGKSGMTLLQRAETKPLFHEDNLVEPEDTYDRFDQKYNPSFSKRSSMGRSFSLNQRSSTLKSRQSTEINTPPLREPSKDLDNES